MTTLFRRRYLSVASYLASCVLATNITKHAIFKGKNACLEIQLVTIAGGGAVGLGRGTCLFLRDRNGLGEQSPRSRGEPYFGS